MDDYDLDCCDNEQNYNYKQNDNKIKQFFQNNKIYINLCFNLCTCLSISLLCGLLMYVALNDLVPLLDNANIFINKLNNESTVTNEDVKYTLERVNSFVNDACCYFRYECCLNDFS
jgi:hypothetical protein